jgi:large conductance mechanosensitive channel
MKAGKHIGSLWQEFKAFAFKGNMIDLAVAVVIGAAFSGVINSLVKDIIMPSIIYVTSTAHQAVNKAEEVAKVGAAAVGVTTKPAETQPAATQSTAEAPPPAAAAPVAQAKTEEKKADDTKPVELDWKIGNVKIGSFIAELMNFVIVAFAVFIVIVKLLGSVMKRVGGTAAPSEPTTKECSFCLSVIPIKARKCAHCTADLPASPTAGAVV